MLRATTLLGATLLALALAAVVQADGEAGLVIHWGDGRVSTHCIAFGGDSITGDEMLERAGYNINQFSGLVCSIGGVGCQHSGSFDSCTCECQSGGDDCVYWSFFEQPYGATWRYSALGAFIARAEDGELHGWQWGEGGPASAPVPPATSFEAVCGHPPGTVSTVPPAATTPQPVETLPIATQTIPMPTATSALSTATLVPSTAQPAVSSEQPTNPAPTEGPYTIVDPGTVVPFDTVVTLREPGPSGGAGIVAFLGVAGGLSLATLAAVAWRVRRGR